MGCVFQQEDFENITLDHDWNAFPLYGGANGYVGFLFVASVSFGRFLGLEFCFVRWIFVVANV